MEPEDLPLPPPAGLPSVSILVPTYQAAAHLPGCFRSIWAQAYEGPVEVIVADGGSTDGTRAIVANEAASGRPVRLLDNPDRVQAGGLNRAAAVATGDILVRCDAQSRLPQSAVQLLVGEHSRIGDANVGGRQVAVPPGTLVGDAVAAVYNTLIGSGGAAYRRARTPQDVDTVYLGSWPREAFLKSGGFSTQVGPNEDTEFNIRWRRQGHRIRLLPDLAIEYVPRADLRALARQYGRYGYWRAVTTRRTGGFGVRQLAGLAPLAAVALALLGRARAAKAPALGYGSALLAAGALTPAPRRARPLIPVVLAVMHLSWGAGFLVSIARAVVTGARRR